MHEIFPIGHRTKAYKSQTQPHYVHRVLLKMVIMYDFGNTLPLQWVCIFIKRLLMTSVQRRPSDRMKDAMSKAHLTGIVYTTKCKIELESKV